MSNNYTTINRRQVLSAVGLTLVGLGTSGQAAAASHTDPQTISVPLTGEAQVPPVETRASGHTTFEFDTDQQEVHYEVHIDFICNPTQAHIHLGQEGENGPVIVWLYPEDEQEPRLISGQFSGILAEGTLTPDDLVGPLEGASFEEAARTLEEVGDYVNVHTEQYPDGEIRGQVNPGMDPDDPDEDSEPELDDPDDPDSDEYDDT